MTEKEAYSRKEAMESDNPQPSYCARDYRFMNGGVSFSFLFFMLLYAVMIYYGFNTFLVNYIENMVVITNMLISMSIMLSIIFIVIVISAYHLGRFGFLWYITKMIIATIISNLGLVWFLAQSFTLTTIMIINIFVYLILISILISVLSWLFIKMLIRVKCR